MTIVTTYQRAFNSKKVDPYPVEALKRVDRPTTRILDDEVQRVDERESAFMRCRRGDFGPHLKQEIERFIPKYPLGGALSWMAGNLKDMVAGIAAEHKAPISKDPAVLARHIKQAAYFLRADLVGICELPPYAVYSHRFPTGEEVHLDHKYAIAILVDQDWRTAEAAVGNDWISGPMSFLAYSTSAFMACILAEYIRRLGYPARAHHARNYQVVVPPILLWAGLGEMCRVGDIVLNPFLGTRFKAAIVTTDMPLAIDKPIDFGLQDFCAKCEKCARYCPSGSIPFGAEATKMHNGYEKWANNVETCLKQRVGNKTGSSCGVCINVCPWNKSYTPFHRFVGWLMRKAPIARRFAVWGDDIMRYGEPKLEHKWWFDLEDVNGDGVLRVPAHSGSRGNYKPQK
jgi:reductive dehalogenase